jgi:UDP-N-acetylmuramoylalanine--D-glutamate ligase
MKLVVLGAAESGVGAAILAQKEGYEVFVSDMGSIKPRYKAMLDAHHIAWEEGHHTEANILSADEVVKSPGIPETAPMVAKLIAQGTPILSEIEFAGRYTDARMICITGSNGKTTTTSLIYHIMRKAGIDAGLAGNIGHSLALQVAEAPHSTYVIELSSFQLDNMYKFRANVAVLLNITPDHLDRYDFKMQNYVDAKMRILQNQTADDTFVYWKEDEHVPNELPKYSDPSAKCGFTDEAQPGSAGYAANGTFVVNAPVHFEMPLSQLSLPGRHNLRNSLAAAIACLAAGVSPEVVRQGLSDFPGVEHRLEKAGTVNGIHFVNDSKATNVDACYCALESMTTPVVLILGERQRLCRNHAICQAKVPCAGIYGRRQQQAARQFRRNRPAHGRHPLHARVHGARRSPGTARRHRAAKPVLRQFRLVQKHGGPRRAVQGMGQAVWRGKVSHLLHT